MTTTTYSAPAATELSAAPLARLRQRLAVALEARSERRALAHAAATVGAYEWSRMEGDLRRI